MKERAKTHLIYLDKDGYGWMQEYSIGNSHPENAEFYSEVPLNTNSKWIDGKPNVSNVQFLTLSPYYPSQRLDVTIEINNESKIMRHENHPAFQGCVKYMPLHVLNFRPIPKHIPIAIHTIGLCYYGHKEAYKTVDVYSDNKLKAIEEGRKLLNPSIVEHVIHVSVKSNEEYAKYYNKTPKFKI